MSFRKIGVIGAGAWGTALAQVCVRAGLDTLLQARGVGSGWGPGTQWMVILTAHPSGEWSRGTGGAVVVDESLLPFQGEWSRCVRDRPGQGGVGHAPRSQPSCS